MGRPTKKTSIKVLNPEMKSLTCRCTGFTSAGLDAIAKCCPGLTSLDVSGCVEMNATLERQVIYGKMNSVFKGIAQIRGFNGLKFLDVSGCIKLNEILNLTLTLTLIDLSGCIKMNEMAFDAIGDCVRLETLYMRDLTQLKDSDLAKIATKTLNLLHLDVSGCRHIAGDAFRAVSKLPFLRELGVRKCPKLREEDFMEGFASMPGVCTLNLGSCWNINDHHLSFLTEECPHLSRLDLSRNRELTASAIDGMILAGNLLWLDVSGCPHVTKEDADRWKIMSPGLFLLWSQEGAAAGHRIGF